MSSITRMDIVDIELNSGNVHRSWLNHSIGSGDNNANAFGVRLFRDSEPVDIGAGWVQGFFRNSQGQNIALTENGVIDGNVTYVTLPQACYNYEGQFTLAIKLVSPGFTSTVTMRIVDGIVDNTNTGGAVAPTGTVPTYQEILAVYENMVDTLADYQEVVDTQNEQISDLKSAIETNVPLLQMQDVLNSTMYKNLFNRDASLSNYSLNTSTGKPFPNSGYGLSYYIPAIQGKTLYFSKDGIATKGNSATFYYVGRYDANFNYLGYSLLATGTTDNETYTVQENDVWLRVDFDNSKTGLQIEYDSVTPYYAYGSLWDNSTGLGLAFMASDMQKSMNLVNSGVSGATKTLLLSDGTTSYNSGFNENMFVTDFISLPLVAGMIIKNAMSRSSAGWYPLAFYDINKKVIGTAYTPTQGSTLISVDIELSSTLIANYSGAKYIRIGGYTAYGTTILKKNEENLVNIPIDIKNADMIKNSGRFTGEKKYIIKQDGSLYYNSGFSDKYFVTDYLLIDLFIGATIKAAESYRSGGIYPIAFYDSKKTIIGTAYTPVTETSESAANIEINSTLLANYPGAKYFVVGGNSQLGTCIEYGTESLTNPYPTYKVNAYPKIFFGGDSVTQGYVIEGTADNPATIEQEMPEYSYPASFNRIYAGAEVTKVAQSGISAYGYYYNKYPNIDFSEYQLIVIELGLNSSDHGSLNIADINTENTNTWCLKKIIEGIRSQNSDAQICLVRSQYFLTLARDVFETICTEYNALFIDLHNAKYLDLADEKYHGYYNNGGTAEVDHAHFTRKGYSAKAYVVARLLGDLLPD